MQGTATMSVRGSSRTLIRLSRFSLRTAFLLTLISSLIVGWVGAEYRQAAKRADVLGEFVEAGVAVTQMSPRGHLLIPDRPWTRRIFGEHFFVNVEGIIAGKYVDKDLLAELQHLRTLTNVYLNNTGATDDVLSRLAANRITALFVGHTEVTDEGLQHIVKMTNLKSLVLFQTAISDAGVDTLLANPNLEKLYLQNTKITDDSISAIAASPLRDKLRELDISDTQLTVDALPELAKLTNLERLHLRNLPISGADLRALRPLTNLRTIDVTGISLTKSDTKALEKMLPSTFVHCGNAQ